MSIDYQFKYMPLVGKLPGKSMAEQTETAINEIAKIVNDNTAQAEIINTLAETANSNSVEALEKATEALETSGRVYIKESNPVNLNDYCESQLIYIDSLASTNLPVNSKGFLEVKTNDDKTQATQVFVDDSNKEIYTRSGAIAETQVGDITTYTASFGAWNKSASTNYVENMVLIRQNSTEYAIGDIARSTSLASYMLLECTSAGTSGASEPDFTGVDVGDIVSDGSLSWTVIQFAKTDSPASVGSATTPVYTDANGKVTASNASVGDANTPVYMDGGEIKSTGKSFADYLPLSGGTMTGDVQWQYGGKTFKVGGAEASDGNHRFGFLVNEGARLLVKDYDATNGAGLFSLIADDGTVNKELRGTPDGALTWNGKEVERVNASGTNYIRYDSGLQICRGTETGVTSSGKSVTFPVAFYGVPAIMLSTTSSTYCYFTGGSSTGCSLKSSASGGATVLYLAVGFWK